MNKNGFKNLIFKSFFNGSTRRGVFSHRQRPLVRMVVPLLISLLVILGCSEKSSSDLVKSPPTEQTQTTTGTIVALGDSLTAGLGVAEDRAYPAQLARRLQADGYNYQVVNAGVSGETSSGARSRMEWVISSLKPDIVILETGANDGLRGLDPELLKTNLDTLVGFMKAHGIEVVLAGMQMLPNLGPDYTRAFSQIYPWIAEKHDVIFIPFFLEGVAGSDTLNQPDKLHPTADGYARIVETIYPYVIKAIKRHEAG
jgi:acyl-CoA thioesterase-1